MMTPMFSLILKDIERSNFGYERIDVLKIYPSTILKIRPEYLLKDDDRVFAIDYTVLYLGDGILSTGNWNEDLFPEIEDGTYDLIT